MSTNSFVSVITIFFNAEAYIQEAIESVIAQNYLNWELLLVNDGSTDGSSDIARDFAAKYPEKVRYLEHPGHQNLGRSATRNLGIYHAKGDYVAFLDADDIWLPNKLEQQVLLLDSHPDAGMLYGNTKYWYSWTGAPEDLQRDFIPELGVQPHTIINPPELVPLYLEGKASVPCTCSAIVRRQVINKIGGFDSSVRGVYDDQIYFAKICLETPVLVSDVCWDWYRQHPASGTSVLLNSGQNYSEHIDFLNWLAAYLSEIKVSDAKVWQALQRQMWLYNLPVWLPITRRNQVHVRRVKKWLLRIEERVLPAPARRMLWVRF